MENTVIQHTFLKFEPSKKNRFSIKKTESQIKQKNPRSSGKKSAVATLFIAKMYCLISSVGLIHCS